ncbi:hypothetical protein D3C86_1870900 [compost metagenome]
MADDGRGQQLALQHLVQQLVVAGAGHVFARREHLLDELGKPQARPVALTAPGIDIRQVAMAAETITTVHHHKELLSVGQLDGQGNALPLQAL